MAARQYCFYICGVIDFTHRWPHALGEPVQRVTQRQQINRAKGRSIRSNQPELIRRIDIGPRARDRAKPPVLALIDHPVFAPMTAPADQLERATAKRMEGMCDPHLLAGRTRVTCSRRPRDKAKVEAAVGIVSRFVLGKLRNRRFFSLVELNDAVRDCVTKINAKVMKHLKQSRNDLFASLDRPALKGLPSERYQYAEWKRCTVAPDYHVEVDDHYYSVPFGLLRETVEARFTDGTVEVFHKGQRIASHMRSRVAHKHTTIPQHMPSSHRRYAEWSPARMLREAEKIGPATIALFEAIMKAKPHPEQGFRSCLGILSLVKSYGPERIEAAARRGNDIRATTYGSIKSILQNGLDRAFAKPNTPDASPIRHANIRGRGYYH